jgi:hypothetical protein
MDEAAQQILSKVLINNEILVNGEKVSYIGDTVDCLLFLPTSEGTVVPRKLNDNTTFFPKETEMKLLLFQSSVRWF